MFLQALMMIERQMMQAQCTGVQPRMGTAVRQVSRAVQMALVLMSCTAMQGAWAATQATGSASAAKAGGSGKLAQESLIVKQLPVVEPNLVFTLDDSGSMAFNYLPDTDMESQIFAFHPNVPSVYPGRALTDDDYNNKNGRVYATYYFQGVLATNDNNVLAARRRSPQVNTLYYNPDVAYEPWVDDNGNRMADADPKAVIFHIGHPDEGIRNHPKLDITGTVSVGKMRVCTGPQPGKIQDDWFVQSWCPSDPSVKEIAPATYYLWKDPKKPIPESMDNDSASNYTRVSIKDHASFDRAGTRTDCAREVGSRRVCTQEEEYRNFANWYQYHRTRMHVAIAAVGTAFAKALGSDIRMGYGRINSATGNEIDGIKGNNIDGVENYVIERGVRRFEGEYRKEFLHWLLTREGNGPTPLMRAMSSVNKYFKRDDSRGPWGTHPENPNTTEEKTNHLSCRRSYHILMTDGQYTFWFPGSNTDKKRKLQDEIYGLESDTLPGNVIQDHRPAEDAAGVRASYQYIPSNPYQGVAKGSLADFAMDAWKNDLRTDLPNRVPPYTNADGENPSFWQNVTTYTLGFGLKGTLDPKTDLPAIKAGTKSWPNKVIPGSPEAIDDLWHAAINGHGRYVDVQNGEQFLTEMKAILSDITERIGSVAGVAVSSRALQADNVKFVPSFMTRRRTGDLKAYQLNADGKQGAVLWSASAKMPHWSWRRIVTGNGNVSGAQTLFWNAERNNELNDATKNALLTSAGITGGSANEKTSRGRQLVAYLLGDENYEGVQFRKRPGRIGQIINSNPVYLGAATNHGYTLLPAELRKGEDSGGSSYRKYLKEKKAASGRSRLVMVGSNEGMVHAFDAKTGAERFAFVPYAVLPEMARLSQRDVPDDRLLMDGPLIETDAWLNQQWRNLVLGTTGAGPAAVFALDMTDTSEAGMGKQSVLWEHSQRSLPELGHVLSAPEVGVLRDGTWVAVFGNGYRSKSGHARLYVVDLKTGALLKDLDTVSSKNGTDGAGTATSPNGLGGVKLLRDGNQIIIGAYAGDLKGNMWKFDLASHKPAEWKVAFDGKPLFKVKEGRPFTAAPATVVHPRGGVMVLAATGKLFEDGDETTRDQEFAYGLWDKSTLVQKVVSAPTGGLSAGSVLSQWQWNEGKPIGQSGQDSLIERSHELMLDARFSKQSGEVDPIKWSERRGWRARLDMIPNRGLRNIVQPQLVSGMVLFEPMTPILELEKRQDLCAEPLNVPGFSLFLDPLSGLMAKSRVIDTNRDGRITDADAKVSGWRVENWTGRSVVLSEASPAPCATADCPKVQARICPPDTLMQNLQNVGESTTVCSELPTPTRWWWRELAVPDTTYNAGNSEALEGGVLTK